MMKNKLARLAKLRQWGGKEAEELEVFVRDGFRQNMLAIESAIKSLSVPNNFLSCQLSSLNVVHPSTAFFTFAFYVRSTNNNNTTNSEYLCKENGNYRFMINLSKVYVDGAKNCLAVIYKNGKELTSTSILETDSVDQFYIPFTWINELQLKANDVIKFGVSNSGPSSTAVTVAYGYLEIKQLTQGIED